MSSFVTSNAATTFSDGDEFVENNPVKDAFMLDDHDEILSEMSFEDTFGFSPEGLNSLLTINNSFKERVEGALEATYEHKKFVNKTHKGPITGHVLRINRVPGLAVVDIDVDKTQPRIVIDAIMNAVLKDLPDDIHVIRSANGGLHIYCNIGDYHQKINANVDACEPTPYGAIIKGVDIIGCFKPNSSAGIMFADSSVKATNGEIRKYELIKGDMNGPVLYYLEDVLFALQFNLKPVKEHIVDDLSEKMDCDEELAKAIINGISKFEVHGLSSRKIEDGVCLFTLCVGINALPDEFIDEAYKQAVENCTLTAHAREHFEASRLRNIGKSSPGVIIKMIRLHNSEYYNSVLKPLIAKRMRLNSDKKSSSADTFDVIRDSFLLKDMREKYPYVNHDEAKIDLLRILRVVDTTPETFLIKQYNGVKNIYEVAYVTKKTAYDKFHDEYAYTTIVDKHEKKVSLWDVYIQHKKLFHIDGLAFHNDNPNVFSYFRGYEYSVLESVKMELIQPFLNHIREVIANGNTEVYEYILTWIASVLQTPSYKTQVALVLLGKQGTGKNVFTNVICKLMIRYAAENVTSLESIIGQFNATLENKKLIVLNELQDASDVKHLNSQKLKSLYSETGIVINQKGIAERDGENVANFIMCSNNMQPVKIERSDRRYMVTTTSDKFRNNKKHFKALIQQFTPEFYENLFTYFMIRDTKGFDTEEIPETEEKEMIKIASDSNYYLFIREYYAEINNMSGKTLQRLYKNFAEENGYTVIGSKTLYSKISEFTTYKQKKINGKPVWVFNVKPEYIEEFKAADAKIEDEIIDGEEVAEMV